MEPFETPAADCYDKPVWTLRTLSREVPLLPPHLLRVATITLGWPISSALRERIMLAVAAENRCVYCQIAHGTFGREAGLSPEEVAQILDGRDDGANTPPGETLALAFVRDLARRGFASRDDALWEALAEHFTDAQREAIQSTARVMNFANRFGNTFDAARERIAGRCERTGAGPLDFLAISSAFLGAAAVVAPVVGLLMLRHRRR